MGPSPAPWDRSRQHVHTAARVRPEPRFRIARSDGLGDGDPPAYRNYGSSLEPCGSAHVQTALHFATCRQLYINRSAGYMVGLGGTSFCHIATSRLPLCIIALRWTDPRPRCTYGDKSCRNRCSVHERTSLIRDIRELKSQMEHRSRDRETYLTGHNATRRSNGNAPITSPISG